MGMPRRLAVPNDCEDAFDKLAPGLAAHAKTALPEQHRFPNGPLGLVVRGYSTLRVEIGPHRLPLGQQFLGRAPRLLRTVCAVADADQALSHLPLDRLHSTNQLLAGELSVQERMPEAEGPVARQLEHRALHGGLAGGFQHGLEVPS